jgi:D-tagatose-1,6-bisphosphate aldolase subunit GatZ/KbaZ
MTFLTADKSTARSRACAQNMPLGDYVLNTLHAQGITALAICPNSEAVLEAAIRSANQAQAPVFLAATLNQVDLDGGYTGWTPQQFVQLTADIVGRYGYQGPVIVGLDHGGPWLKDKQTREGWTLEQAMEGVQASLAVDITAGYDLLHIDPTVDRSLPAGQPPEMTTVVTRTLDLLEHAEKVRCSLQRPPVTYEVGTEEIHGGLAQPQAFRSFLEMLKAGLQKRSLQHVWPKLIVGAVGTDLHTTYFNPDVASQLVNIAAEYDSLVKGHYTDSVANPEAYPQTGMGGANVGPEFTEAEYQALAKLAREEETLYKQGKLTQSSHMMAVLQEAVVASGRWEKWRQPEEKGLPFDEFTPERREWLVCTGCRYIWSQPEVLVARAMLYANHPVGSEAAKNVVLDSIGEVIQKYFTAFRLTDTLSMLQ